VAPASNTVWPWELIAACAVLGMTRKARPDIIGFKQSGRTRLLTQGSYTLYFLLNSVRFERLFATGLTMFGAGPGGSISSAYQGSAGSAMTAGFEQRPGKRKAGLCVESGFACPGLLAIVSVAAACVSMQDAERS
jgi:hypothetical protein